MSPLCWALSAALLVLLAECIRCHAVIRRLRYDALTGALVRSEFMRLVRRRLRTGSVLAILDLNGLKRINDRFGHAAGDLLLAGVAERITRGIDRRGLLGRLGGDEFAVLVHSPAALRELQAQIAQPVSAGAWSVSVACGAVEAAAGVGLSDLLREADRAMYAAKRESKRTEFSPKSRTAFRR